MDFYSDGVYKVSTDASGLSTHTPISPIIKTAFKPRGTNTKRSNAKRVLQGAHDIGCSGYGFLGVDADNAVQALKNQCQGGSTGGGEVSANLDFYSVFGSVVAYFCNYSSLSNHCYQDEIQDAIQTRISAQCGSYVAGWDIVIDRALEYGYQSPSSNFCGRGI